MGAEGEGSDALSSLECTATCWKWWTDGDPPTVGRETYLPGKTCIPWRGFHVPKNNLQPSVAKTFLPGGKVGEQKYCFHLRATWSVCRIMPSIGRWGVTRSMSCSCGLFVSPKARLLQCLRFVVTAVHWELQTTFRLFCALSVHFAFCVSLGCLGTSIFCLWKAYPTFTFIILSPCSPPVDHCEVNAPSLESKNIQQSLRTLPVTMNAVQHSR